MNRDADGRVTCCSGYCIELKTQFSIPRLFHSNELGMWEWNGISGECQFCDNYHSMLGYGPGDTFPETFEEWVKIVHPDDLDAVEFQRQLAIYPEFSDDFECSIRLRHKKGHYVWTIGKGFVSQRDHLGHAISLRGTNQSIEVIRKKYEEALQKSIIDPLTNSYTRDFFSKKWNDILKSDTYPISFLYIDICGLKLVNDFLGHEQGDEVLLRAVEIIDKIIQMTKFIIRMGGDEFLVILPNCTSELASACIKNLEKAQSQRGEQEIPVVFAIGKSSMIIETPLREIISSAEREMQRNKEHSRHKDRTLLLSYIEHIKGKEITYIDTRVS
ncbi:sensor domain-containing diguanylate cyclase [uncultured Bilophila sp.]|uniref:sensor domain-containing diguanylate cyclase n=1 Tax=uncultured Bilophila sp. TaxID=529385 RepID=UPI00280BA222|nr:sensor domain-containing diguanylate cyclase [uncultured Bilophila sp.]